MNHILDLHKMNIKMASWVKAFHVTEDLEMSRCQHSYICHYNNVKPVDKQDVWL